ncbi:MAG: CBS domain-containing protein [Candidatus Hydrogenedentota bacterium]|nr:MAG: CBS domain-containing protein [Candidatus Hydrogenedentota bacterium]
MQGDVACILDRKGRTVYSIEPDVPVFEALQKLAEHDVGALPVMKDGKLVGIFSERDYARKVILKGKGSRQTPVREIMVTNVYTIAPEAQITDCMKLMTEKRIRHLPVVENEKVVGVISIGDVVNAIISHQQQIIDHLSDYISGNY